MMGAFSDSIWFETHTCGGCGVTFGMPKELYTKRLKDRKNFYCPNGCCRHFIGRSKEDELKAQLRVTQKQLDRAWQERQETAEKLGRVARSYGKVRERIKNGTCPCCNRNFPKLAAHMRTKHPSFGSPQQLKTLRELYGLTQVMLAEEVGVSVPYVSSYENQKPLPAHAKVLLDAWIEEQAA